LPATLPSSISAETRTAAFDHSPETPANSLSTQIPAGTPAPSPHVRSSTGLRRPALHRPAKSFHSPAENNPDTPETRPIAASRSSLPTPSRTPLTVAHTSGLVGCRAP